MSQVKKGDNENVDLSFLKSKIFDDREDDQEEETEDMKQGEVEESAGTLDEM
jgi:hypothetical protein